VVDETKDSVHPPPSDRKRSKIIKEMFHFLLFSCLFLIFPLRLRCGRQDGKKNSVPSPPSREKRQGEAGNRSRKRYSVPCLFFSARGRNTLSFSCRPILNLAPFSIKATKRGEKLSFGPGSWSKRRFSLSFQLL
jgi:hypothetical protein